MWTGLYNSIQQPPLSTSETLVSNSCVGKKPLPLISWFYNMLAENHKENSEDERLEWILDL